MEGYFAGPENSEMRLAMVGWRWTKYTNLEGLMVTYSTHVSIYFTGSGDAINGYRADYS